ncbi:MAG: hypothetical protein Q9228_005786 [Teloschistes exilis]
MPADTSNTGALSTPALFHKVKNERSILALAVFDGRLFAGTQDGEILVWSLKTYERLASIKAHNRSVLSLFVSEEDGLLFSSARDAIVNVCQEGNAINQSELTADNYQVWDIHTLVRKFSIYSVYDVGDVFCVTYSATTKTVYLGAMNTSIQWCELNTQDCRKADKARHPSERNHRFFDSVGPGGAHASNRATDIDPFQEPGVLLEIDKEHIKQYAHHGYTYSMLLAGGPACPVFAEEMLISGGGDGSIKIWSLDIQNHGAISEFQVMESEDESVLALAIDRTLLYSGRVGGEINVWDLDTFQLIRRFNSCSADVQSICVGHQSVFCGNSDGFTRAYDPACQRMHEWQAHNGKILASVMTVHQGKLIYVTGGSDDCIAEWDVGRVKIGEETSKPSYNERLLDSLSELVAIPTVSSKPDFAHHCRRGASWLKSCFKDLSADSETLSTTDSTNPVVYARFRGDDMQTKKRRTLLFYGHYDVVPADNKGKSWVWDPFEMRGLNGYLYGRGVTDNKGPLLAALYAVVELKAAKSLQMDVVFLIEGEEECGSKGFQEAVVKNKDLIGDIDWILLANSYWLDDDMPCLTYGLRGVVHATVQITSKRPNVHSGIDGSQGEHEAMQDLINILAVLTESNGKIAIPGFDEDVLPLTLAEERNYAAISEALVSRDPSRGDAQVLAQKLQARWRKPSLTISRFNSSAPAGTSVIPQTVSADLSLRLVPNQTTAAIQKALKAVLSAAFRKLNSSNELNIILANAAEPWLGDPGNEIFQTLEEAVFDVWGPQAAHTRRGSVHASGHEKRLSTPGTSDSLTGGSDHHSQATADSPISPTSPTLPAGQRSWRPFFIREGGSIPAIRFLEQEFKAPAAHLPCGQASDKAHLDNERLRLSNLYKSKEIFKQVFKALPMKKLRNDTIIYE